MLKPPQFETLIFAATLKPFLCAQHCFAGILQFTWQCHYSEYGLLVVCVCCSKLGRLPRPYLDEAFHGRSLGIYGIGCDTLPRGCVAN